MNAADILPMVGALLGGGGLVVAVFNAFLGREGLRAQAANTMSQTEMGEHARWMEDADRAYQRVSAECNRCEIKLDKVLAALYWLLEDLEEQIVPMLMIPNTDHRETRVALRASVRRTRDAVIEAGRPAA